MNKDPSGAEIIDRARKIENHDEYEFDTLISL